MRVDFGMRPFVRTISGTWLVACFTLAGCAQMQPAAEPSGAPTAEPPAAVAPPREPPAAESTSAMSTGWRQRGRVSLYGNGFAGKPTASGDTFDPQALTMAHRTLPFGTLVRVTNLENQQTVEVVVNDRGPFVAGRIADLSAGAARQIGMVADGVVSALIEVVRPAKSR